MPAEENSTEKYIEKQYAKLFYNLYYQTGKPPLFTGNFGIPFHPHLFIFLFLSAL